MKLRAGSLSRTLVASAVVAAVVAGLVAITPAISSSFLTRSAATKKFVRTASAQVQHVEDFTGTSGTDLGPTYKTLMSKSIKIKRGKVLASAEVSLRDTNSGSNQVECFLKLGGKNLDHWVATLSGPAGSGSRRPVYPLVGGSGKLSAGTYKVRVFCGEAAANTGVIFDSGSLVLWNG